MPRILFVSGFSAATRARDLAYEFERYGPLVRCDVPAPRNSHSNSNPTRDAEEAYHDMHGRHFDGARISIQWAKNPPSSMWRADRRSPPPRRDRDRSRSPRRSARDRVERDPRDRERDRDERDVDRDRDRRRRSRSPERRRSPTPDRRRDDRARTPPPPPMDDVKEDDRAKTPPYDH
ncbi:hypothetical protein EUX98_g3883 [Antrodiella citrinella]|uniref:RRM domain-containing protein n=1 Tax=Antrodiella citrinella TaxID=2447956 RepID=A0A4S4N3H7_9APHY|nr:hypothetical protein EUX98_g3883 [Antrodiella citrinella]